MADDATTARTTAAFDRVVDIETPEQVAVSYTLAGLGSRAAAALLDLAIILGGLLLLDTAVLVLAGALGLRSTLASLAGAWAVALLLVVQFAIFWGYFVYFEMRWDGQTPGKRQLGLRVVQDGGFSISPGASAVRNVARAVDMQPFFLYGVGAVSALASRSGKRLGDMLAGTIVVRERLVSFADTAPADTAPAGALPPADAAHALLSDAEFALLDRFVTRREALPDAQRRALVARLAARFAAYLPGDTSPAAALLALREREWRARAAGAAARGATGSARERHALLADGGGRWRAFASLVAEVRRRGLRTMTDDEVSAFAARYREAATDLARLRTAAQGQDLDALFALGRLVGAGHNLLYRPRALPLRRLAAYLAWGVPGEVRRSRWYIALAALLLFGPMAASYGAVMRHPDVAERLLPAEMLDRAETGAERVRTGRGYIDVGAGERPVLASQVIRNNVGITYAVFALGITAGIGTAFLLIVNGISIGSALGLYASRGIGHLLLEFVAPHGVLELTAIALAGGGGLLVASGLVLPGALTRRAALVTRGRRAITLVAGATVMLLAAGVIEGLISPRADIPPAVKYGVAAATGVLIVAWFTRGRGAAAAEPAGETAYSAARALTSR